MQVNKAKRPLEKYEPALILLILLTAIVVRVWGLGFGLPHTYHFDEPTYISAALNTAAGNIGRQPNPTGFSNILLVEYGAYFLLGRATGVFDSLAQFEQAYRADISNFMLLSRLTSAIIGTINVYALYRLGKAVFGRRVGLFAAAFLSVAFLHVRDSHYGVPDVSMTAFVTVCVWFAIMAYTGQNRTYLLLTAACAGFAVAVKWTAWPVGFTLLIVAMSLKSNGFAEQSFRHYASQFMYVVFTGLLGFIIGGFQILLESKAFFDYALLELTAGEAGGFGDWQIDSVPGWLFYIKTMAYGIGYLPFGAALGGIVLWLISSVKERAWWMFGILLSFPISYYLIMGSTRHYFSRYTLPFLPFMALFSAVFISRLYDYANAKKWPLQGKVFVVSLALLLPAQSLVSSIRHDILLTRVDTRTIAKEWIEANLPEGTRIAIDYPIHGPPLASVEEPTTNSLRFFDVTYMRGTGLSDQTLDWYRQEGYEYLITSSFVTELSLVDADRGRQRKDFYDSLDGALELVKVFRPTDRASDPDFIFDEMFGPAISLWQRELPGPTIKLYRINN